MAHNPPYEIDRTHTSAWREYKEPGSGWQNDIGYKLQDVLQAHHYDYKNKGEKPDTVGWHACTCGQWEGYWSGFEPHVADQLREAVSSHMTRNAATRDAT